MPKIHVVELTPASFLRHLLCAMAYFFARTHIHTEKQREREGGVLMIMAPSW